MSVASIGASGMEYAGNLLLATAVNTANAQTPGFESVVARSVALEGGGAGTVFSRDPAAGAMLLDLEGRYVEASNVNLERETVNRILAVHVYAMNAAVVEAGTRMMDAWLDG